MIAVEREGAAGLGGCPGPVTAFIQSEREKKSASTLKLPQTVQRKGKAAAKSQSARSVVVSARRCGGSRVTARPFG